MYPEDLNHAANSGDHSPLVSGKFLSGNTCVSGIYEGQISKKGVQGSKSVGLREMVMTMSVLASKVNRKINKKTMKSIFCKCGFCVNPKRINLVTFLGDIFGIHSPRNTFKEYRMIATKKKE